MTVGDRCQVLVFNKGARGKIVAIVDLETYVNVLHMPIPDIWSEKFPNLKKENILGIKYDYPVRPCSFEHYQEKYPNGTQEEYEAIDTHSYGWMPEVSVKVLYL